MMDDLGEQRRTGNLERKSSRAGGMLMALHEHVFCTCSGGVNDFHYTYDIPGRLETVEVHERNDVAVDADPGTAGNQPETTAYEYDLLGNLDLMTTPDGVITDYIYDALNRLDEQIAYRPDETPGTFADNNKLAEFDYTVRADGKRTRAIETFWFDSDSNPSTLEAHTNQIDWTYDNAGQLIDEVFNHYNDLLDQTEHFTYDLTGNRLEKTLDKGNDSTIDETTTYTFDENDRMLSAATDTDGDQQPDETTTFGYTGTQQTSEQIEIAGTLTSSAAYSYDLQGRMAVAEITTYTGGNPSRIERTSYEYGPDGIRVSKLSETDADANGIFETRTLSEYLIDPANHTGYQQVLQETVTDADTGAELKKIVYTIGHDVIAQTTFGPSGPTEGETLILHADGHGSTRVLTDLAAAIVTAFGAQQIFHYTAYGKMLGVQAANAATTLLYSGEQFDVRIGKQYLRARYYDAATGTFNRLDPFAGNMHDPQSLHKYLYTHADPINGIDPTGRDLIGTISAIGTRIGMFAANNPAIFGAITGGISGGIDGYLENYKVSDGVKGFFAGAIIGAIGGKIFGKLFGALGPWMSKLHPTTTMRLLQALFAVNLASVGISVYNAKSTGQAIFRGSLGLIGLIGNGLAIQRVAAWARKLRNADTLVLASTGDGPLTPNAIHNNINPKDLENIGDAIPLVADQTDLPLPDGIFSKITGRRVQVRGQLPSNVDEWAPDGHGTRAVKEWYRVAKSGAELEVSLNSLDASEAISAFEAAGWINVEKVGSVAPSSLIFRATKP